MRRHPEGLRDALGDAVDRLLHLRAHRRPVGAHGAAHHHAPRDLVRRHPALDRAHGDDGGLQRIDVAGDDRLQRHQQVARRHHRVAGEMGQRGVAGMAVDRDGDARAGRHHRPVMHRDGARIEPRPVVEAEDALHREAVEQAVREHGARPAAALLGGLEDEMHGARPARIARQQGGGAEQGGGVAVMPAGMHHAGFGGGMGGAGRLRDGQRVHVRPQPDRAVRLPARQGRHHPGSAHAGGEGDAELAQALLHEGGGRVLLVGELGMGVQMAPPFREGRVQGLVHASSSPESAREASRFQACSVAAARSDSGCSGRARRSGITTW